MGELGLCSCPHLQAALPGPKSHLGLGTGMLPQRYWEALERKAPQERGCQEFLSSEAPVGWGAAMADTSCICSHQGSLSAPELVLPELKTPLVETEGSDRQGGPLDLQEYTQTPRLAGAGAGRAQNKTLSPSALCPVGISGRPSSSRQTLRPAPLPGFPHLAGGSWGHSQMKEKQPPLNGLAEDVNTEPGSGGRRGQATSFLPGGPTHHLTLRSPFHQVSPRSTPRSLRTPWPRQAQCWSPPARHRPGGMGGRGVLHGTQTPT